MGYEKTDIFSLILPFTWLFHSSKFNVNLNYKCRCTLQRNPHGTELLFKDSEISFRAHLPMFKDSQWKC